MRMFLGMGAVAAVLLAACGGHLNTGGSGNGPAAGGNGGGGGKGVAVLTVNTGQASGVGTVLVNAQGLTLYHWKGETTSNLMCTGACTSTWVPLQVAGGGSPTGGMHVTGSLDTFTRSDGAGTEVTYNGLPLYTFTGDSAPGQASGQGVSNFYVATPSSSASGSGGGGRYGGGGGSGSPSPSSTGYGY